MSFKIDRIKFGIKNMSKESDFCILVCKILLIFAYLLLKPFDRL